MNTILMAKILKVKAEIETSKIHKECRNIHILINQEVECRNNSNNLCLLNINQCIHNILLNKEVLMDPLLAYTIKALVLLKLKTAEYFPN